MIVGRISEILLLKRYLNNIRFSVSDSWMYGFGFQVETVSLGNRWGMECVVRVEGNQDRVIRKRGEGMVV